MNQLLETIAWASLMGFETERSSDPETGTKLQVTTPHYECIMFWFDTDGDLKFTELL